MENTYIVNINGNDVEVNELVYKELYADKIYEDSVERGKSRNKIISYDKWDTERAKGSDFIQDISLNIEDEVIKNIELLNILSILSQVDKDNIIFNIFILGYTETELARIIGVSQVTINKKKNKILNYLRKVFKNL